MKKISIALFIALSISAEAQASWWNVYTTVNGSVRSTLGAGLIGEHSPAASAAPALMPSYISECTPQTLADERAANAALHKQVGNIPDAAKLSCLDLYKHFNIALTLGLPDLSALMDALLKAACQYAQTRFDGLLAPLNQNVWLAGGLVNVATFEGGGNSVPPPIGPSPGFAPINNLIPGQSIPIPQTQYSGNVSGGTTADSQVVVPAPSALIKGYFSGSSSGSGQAAQQPQGQAAPSGAAGFGGSVTLPNPFGKP